MDQAILRGVQGEKPVFDGAVLTGASQDHMMAVALTTASFTPPFTVTTIARTDSTNLRLYWHVGEIIFNWEVSIRRLKIHDPETGCWWDAPDRANMSRQEMQLGAGSKIASEISRSKSPAL